MTLGEEEYPELSSLRQLPVYALQLHSRLQMSYALETPKYCLPILKIEKLNAIRCLSYNDQEYIHNICLLNDAGYGVFAPLHILVTRHDAHPANAELPADLCGLAT
jgi:hypothetical protein